jgi:signal peptidase II
MHVVTALAGVVITAVGLALFHSSVPISVLCVSMGVLATFLGSVQFLASRPVGMPRHLVVFVFTLVYWLMVDQATKAWTVATMRVGVDEIEVIPGLLSAVHAQNFGAAFSSLEGQYWVFITFTAIATAVVLDLVRRMRADQVFTAATLGMILSGAWGNGLDRLRIGHVTDFIRVYTDSPSLAPWFITNFGTNTWPIFNIADSVLLVGVTVFLAHYLFLDEDENAVDPDALVEETR